MRFSSCLYAGRVFHRRSRPREHVLRYRVFSLLLDLSEIDSLDARLRWFSRNRFNLFSFHDADFGDGKHPDLPAFVRSRLELAGIGDTLSRVMLSCYPRVLGYAFNPLSLYYCFGERGQCLAVIHEVHNTFGERHWYVLPASVNDDSTSGTQWIHQTCDKAMFVSPFANMDMYYRFRLNRPDDRQVVVIRACDDQGVLITASYVGQRRPLTDARLLGSALVYPLMGFKIIIGIHWEAFLLWCKRVPWFRHQPLESDRSCGQTD